MPYGYTDVPNSAPAQVGDKVIYFGSEVYGAYTSKHSAIVTNVDAQGNVTTVASQFGEGAIY